MRPGRPALGGGAVRVDPKVKRRGAKRRPLEQDAAAPQQPRRAARLFERARAAVVFARQVALDHLLRQRQQRRVMRRAFGGGGWGGGGGGSGGSGGGGRGGGGLQARGLGGGGGGERGEA